MALSVREVNLAASVLYNLATNAYAYIDHGTGSYAFQTIAALVAGAFLFLKIFWSKLKSFFCRYITGSFQSMARFNG